MLFSKMAAHVAVSTMTEKERWKENQKAVVMFIRANNRRPPRDMDIGKWYSLRIGCMRSEVCRRAFEELIELEASSCE